MLYSRALVLALAGIATALPSEVRSKTPKIGYINVSVATLWTDSSKPRSVDAPALTSPAHVKKWLDTMTTAQFLDLTDSDRTQTQALFGAKVELLDHQDGWYSIAVPGQPTPKNSVGYPGWVPEAQVTTDAPLYGLLQESRPFAQVNKGPTVPLYRDLGLKDKIMDVSYDTRLPMTAEIGDAIQVAVPGGLAFLKTKHAAVYKSSSDIPYPTGEDLVEAGRMFIGQPYLWGGTSGYGYDCSGFTHSLYDAHGISIGRDAAPEAYFTGHGAAVGRDDLQAGDLIFYASNLSDPTSIYHVAMYSANGHMLEAYGAGIPVRNTPVRFIADYWGAERYLK